MSRGANVLLLSCDEATQVIRRRGTGAARAAKARKAAAARAEKKLEWLPGRAFQALILFYEKAGDPEMADLLRLDLDRFMRNKDLREQIRKGVLK